MEKSSSLKQSSLLQSLSQSLISTLEWEALVEDFQSGDPSRQFQWLSQHPTPLSLLDLALASLLRRDFPLKPLVILFLEEFGHLLVRSPPEDAAHALSALAEALRIVVQSPADSAPTAYALKEQMMVAVTSIAITIDGLDYAPRQLEAVWRFSSLYIVCPPYDGDPVHLGSVGAIQCPVYLNSVARNNQDLSDDNLRDIRRVMSFLLERPLILTPLAIAEMVFMLTRVVKTLEAQMSGAAALLKVQFSGLLYSYDPMLCHVVLMLYSHFSDAFSGDEREIARRLTLLPKEAQQPLVYRLLALHWLLGIASRPPDKKNLLISLAPSFYPSLFDPLALKAAKLDVLALIAVLLDSSSGKNDKGKDEEGKKADEIAFSPMKLFQACLVCVSAFRWLPPWSTETLVVFRTLHKFLTGAVSRPDSDDSTVLHLMESTNFCSLQSTLVDMVVEHPGLVPVVAAFVDRLKSSRIHRLLGERLLQTFDESLLPKLEMDLRISVYFSILERIAENDKIPPRRLLQFLLKFMVFLVDKHGPDSGLRLWSKGSKVLRICRTVMMNHHSSRIFNVLSHLLSFTSQCYPDLEVRDSARIYLRMLVCIPGKKLRHLLNPGEQLTGVTPSPHPGFFYQAPTPSSSWKKTLSASSCIHLERAIPLLLKQSWSLTIPNLDAKVNGPSSLEVIRDAPPIPDPTEEAEENLARISLTQEPLRMVDSKVAEILDILRRHFGSIPDFRHMKGLKIEIPCSLRFDAGILASGERAGPPALYAVVLTFSSTAKYGPIPPCRVPFLLGESPANPRAMVLVEKPSDPRTRRSSVVVELEPREPMPGLIDVTVQANAEDGQLISGRLESIPVGIEDIPRYYSDLFNALWEACSSSSNTARETFPLKGARGVAAVNGTGSVKLLDTAAASLIATVECHLAPFVVGFTGASLADALKSGGGALADAFWQDDHDGGSGGSAVPVLQLGYLAGEDDADTAAERFQEADLGSLLVLIFLPPRFHLLLKMEVSEPSTLVRIRTDHWPCLAYIDEFLESLFLGI
ncbi:unnamed protein product [Spirodela intermedia]|uniref:Uncharacterized protein n=1 Tax=Spirodela intermedia TaxID=51605 RepID=A0A7I8IXY6_SPIIN|nr:unnamed protein product [Spirodela intermedia]CAA6662718.1 unnamed protein product [Spirodela intermedia]